MTSCTPIRLVITSAQHACACALANSRILQHNGRRKPVEEFGKDGCWAREYYGALGETVIFDHLERCGIIDPQPIEQFVTEGVPPRRPDVTIDGVRLDIKCPVAVNPQYPDSLNPHVTINAPKHRKQVGQCDGYLICLVSPDGTEAQIAVVRYDEVSRWPLKRNKNGSEYFCGRVAALAFASSCSHLVQMVEELRSPTHSGACGSLA